MHKELEDSYFLIPARRNSKGFPFKNRKLFTKTIETIPTEYYSKVYVSTDDEFIVDECLKYGINVINRPIELSTDASSVKDVMLHFIDTIKIEDKNIILLFLTYTERTWKDILSVFDFYIENNSDSVICAEELEEHPYLMLHDKSDFKGELIVEHPYYRRQDYPSCFKHSMFVGCYKSSICDTLTNLLINKNTQYYKVSRKIDVDTQEDSDQIIEASNIYVDIDETICFYDGERNYEEAIPNEGNIAKINKLYDEGHIITYWTARGSVTGLDWMETTIKQLKDWGCKYHKVSVGLKPDYDLLICDKTKRIEEI